MTKVYGNLLVAMEKTGTSKKELGYSLKISPNTLTCRFNEYGHWTLREIKIIQDLLNDKGYKQNLEELFKYE